MKIKFYLTSLFQQGVGSKTQMAFLMALFLLVAANTWAMPGLNKSGTHFSFLNFIFHGSPSPDNFKCTSFDPPGAPNLSYKGVIANYPTAMAIAALAPTIVGGNLIGNGHYGVLPVSLGSGFNNPSGVAVDGAGNVFVADNNNSAIKKIDATSGVITSLGSGFNHPSGVAVDATGNIYVADTYNNAVKKIAAGSGAITTLGSGFSNPHGIAVDGAGNVYVADTYNNAVKKIALGTGTITTLGSGYYHPYGVAVDAMGNVYVADEGNNAVKAIAAGTGAVTSLGDGFRYPIGVAVDDKGNVFVADQGHNAVKEIAATDGSIFSLGSGFNGVYGVAVDVTGNVYVADQVNNAINEIMADIYSISPALPAGLSMDPVTGIISGTPTAVTPNTTYTVTTQNTAGPATATLSFATFGPPSIAYSGVAASYPTGTAIGSLNPTVAGVELIGNGTYSAAPVAIGSGFVNPSDVAVDQEGNVYVADYNNNAIKEIPASGGPILTLGSRFDHPQGLAVDAAGNVYVAVTGANTVKSIAAGNGAITTLGSGFSSPTGIDVDAQGNVYLTDEGHNRVKKIAAGNGAVTQLGGVFNLPMGIAVDGTGNVYVVEYGQHSIQKIAAADGTATSYGEEFSSPYGVAADAAGNVYITDISKNAVQKIAAGTGIITTLASGFSNPTGVTLDAAGNLYVADFYHNAVKKIKADIYSIEPVLPAGLTMDPQTGIISGTPMQATPTTTYTVTTQNGAGVATTTLSFSTSAPLPVNWIALNGHLSKNQNAVLNWQVAENSVASFEIQKSAGNNKDSSFRTIGAVVSQGNGTNNYSFTDPQVFNGNSLYRIAETDHDGKRSYSPVISLTGITQVAIQVYPNPTKNKITVVIPANLLNTDASLINMIGKVIQTVHLSDLSNQVSLQSLSSGLYVLRFKDGSSRQIIKQ